MVDKMFILIFEFDISLILMILIEGNGDGTCTKAPKYVKPKSCRVDANAFLMYKRFPFPNKGTKKICIAWFGCFLESS